MLSKRRYRALSGFSISTKRWAPISLPLRDAHGRVTHDRATLTPRDAHNSKQKLSLVSWNVNAFHSRPVARSTQILNYIFEGAKFPSPDIVFLQEVTPGVRDALLGDGRVRSGFLATDAEDDKSFDGVSFTTMTLLSNKRFVSDADPHLGLGGAVPEAWGKLMIQGVFRLILPSIYGRDALCVDIVAPAAPGGSVLRLINVHLDSLDSFAWRTQQIKVLADVLHEPGCGIGVIAGDFNAVTPADHELVDKNQLIDAWVALHGSTELDGATWGVDAEREGGRKPKRLDKVVLLGLEAEEMEVLKPGRIEVPRPGAPPLYSPWSDHCGIRCTLNL